MGQTGQSDEIHSPEACARSVVSLIWPLAWSIAAIALVAAKPGPQAPAVPVQSSIAPPEVANDPQNRLTLELSNRGTVVILLRPDVAPLHVERMRQLAKNGFYAKLWEHQVNGFLPDED